MRAMKLRSLLTVRTNRMSIIVLVPFPLCCVLCFVTVLVMEVTQ